MILICFLCDWNSEIVFQEFQDEVLKAFYELRYRNGIFPDNHLPILFTYFELDSQEYCKSCSNPKQRLFCPIFVKILGVLCGAFGHLQTYKHLPYDPQGVILLQPNHSKWKFGRNILLMY